MPESDKTAELVRRAERIADRQRRRRLEAERVFYETRALELAPPGAQDPDPAQRVA